MAGPITTTAVMIGKKLIFDLFSEPENIIKILLIIFCVILLVTAIPVIAIFSLFPSSDPGIVQYYKEVASETNVSWVDMLAYDTVRYNNDFENIERNDVLNTAFLFMDIEANKYKDTKDGWKKLSDNTLRDYDEVTSFIESKGYPDYDNMTIGEIFEALDEIDGKEFEGKLYDYKYTISISRNTLDDLTDDFTEEQNDWLESIVADNIIPSIYGEYYELPDKIDIITSGYFAFPTPDLDIITSPYGWRTHPVTNEGNFHSGVDISGSNAHGKPIIAVAEGEVTVASYSNGNAGNWVEITHIKDEDTWTTRYMHMAQINVNIGDKVEKGTVIGTVGNTGRSTGPHLHFELRYMGNLVNPIDYIATDYN